MITILVISSNSCVKPGLNKEYQGLEKFYGFDETISKDDKKSTLKKYNKLILNTTIIFFSTDIMTLKNLVGFLSNQSIFLATFSNYLDKFSKVKPQKKNKKRRNKCV